MATTQYIGARYVPLFFTNPDDNSNNWKSGVAYDPLTVVTDLNQSYTSKIPVPASVGRPSENPTYWILTGAYNAQIEQYRQEIEDYEEATDARLDILENRKFIFIGDSYGTGEGADATYTSYIVRCANALGLTENVNYWKNSIGGASFHGWNGRSTFISLLNAVTVPDEDEITDIIVCGGLNDAADPATLSENTTAVTNFVTAAKTRFKNAKIHVGLVGWSKNVNGNLKVVNLAEPAYKFAALSGGNFFDLRASLHDYGSNFQSDGSHPNDGGHKSIGWSLANYLMGGEPVNGSMQNRQLTVTASGINSTAFTMYQYIDAHNVYLSIARTTLTLNASVTIGSDTEVEIGKLNAANYIAGISNLGAFHLNCDIRGTTSDGAKQIISTGVINIYADGTVKIRPNFSQYTFTNVSHIVIPGQFCGACPIDWC